MLADVLGAQPLVLSTHQPACAAEALHQKALLLLLPYGARLPSTTAVMRAELFDPNLLSHQSLVAVYSQLSEVLPTVDVITTGYGRQLKHLAWHAEVVS